MHELTQTATDRLASVLYDSAVATGLEGRFDWSEVAADYEKFALEVLSRMFLPPPPNRSAYAKCHELPPEPQGHPHPYRG